MKKAKQTLKGAKKTHSDKHRLNALETRLTRGTKKPHKVLTSPPQEHLASLLESYKRRNYREAEILALSFTQEFPKHEFGWKVLGAVLEATGRHSEAADAKKIAVGLSPRDAQAHTNLGNSLRKVGRVEEALASHRQAIAIKPDFAEAHYNLANLLEDLDLFDEAESFFLNAIKLKPDFAEAHGNVGNLLKKRGRFDEAVSSYVKVIELKPSAEANLNLGITLRELGRLDEAEACFMQVIFLNPDLVEGHDNLLMCLYLLDKQLQFFAKLESLLRQGATSATIGSLVCRGELKYAVKNPNPFCQNPLAYVSHINLNEEYNFQDSIVEPALLMLDDHKTAMREQRLLTNGYQTAGNLFDVESSFTDAVQAIILREVEKYRIKFQNSTDGLITKWPNRFRLHGWLIRMNRGGELKPHIHENGWLSGSIYINVPPKSKAESGNLVVSLGDESDANDKRINETKMINVITGSLVLFPASLTHYTIPFEAEEERIVLAFDVKEMI